MAVINPSEKKLANRTSVQWVGQNYSTNMLTYYRDGPKIVITKVTRQRLPLNITYNRMKQNVFAMKILLVHVVDYGSTVF